MKYTNYNTVITQVKKKHDWLEDGIIFATLHGSHAYGLNTPESDEDVRGICIAPKKLTYGFFSTFEQVVLNEPDTTIFSIQKFFKLAGLCNPNCVEILFTEPEDHIIVTPIGQKIIDNRHLFLSKMAKHSFMGYAKSQLHRIASHRKWINSEISKREFPPIREELGLPPIPEIDKDQYDQVNSMIQRKLDSWILNYDEFNDPQKIFLRSTFSGILNEIGIGFDETWQSAGRLLGFNENFIEIITKEKQYRNLWKDWDNFQAWKKDRNPKRAALEAKCGYDSKHGSHLIRLLLQCRDLFKNGELKIKNPDYTKYLLDIKNGNISYDEIIDFSQKLEKEIYDLFQTSKLPLMPNNDALDDLCVEIVDEFYSK